MPPKKNIHAFMKTQRLVMFVVVIATLLLVQCHTALALSNCRNETTGTAINGHTLFKKDSTTGDWNYAEATCIHAHQFDGNVNTDNVTIDTTSSGGMPLLEVIETRAFFRCAYGDRHCHVTFTGDFPKLTVIMNSAFRQFSGDHSSLVFEGTFDKLESIQPAAFNAAAYSETSTGRIVFVNLPELREVKDFAFYRLISNYGGSSPYRANFKLTFKGEFKNLQTIGCNAFNLHSGKPTAQEMADHADIGFPHGLPKLTSLSHPQAAGTCNPESGPGAYDNQNDGFTTFRGVDPRPLLWSSFPNLVTNYEMLNSDGSTTPINEYWNYHPHFRLRSGTNADQCVSDRNLNATFGWESAAANGTLDCSGSHGAHASSKKRAAPAPADSDSELGGGAVAGIVAGVLAAIAVSCAACRSGSSNAVPTVGTQGGGNVAYEKLIAM